MYLLGCARKRKDRLGLLSGYVKGASLIGELFVLVCFTRVD